MGVRAGVSELIYILTVTVTFVNFMKRDQSRGVVVGRDER